MKDLSNEELLAELCSENNKYVVGIEETPEYKEALSRLSAGEEAVKEVERMKKRELDYYKFSQKQGVIIDRLKSDKRELVEVLNKISNPIFYLRKEAESSGGTLNGFAVQLSNDANYLKGIARTALAKHKEAL